MSRLTNKFNRYGYVLNHKEDFTENSYQVIQKLGKLEDLEEEIGCPLEVVFKALKKGIYHNEKFKRPILILDEDSFKKHDFSLVVVGTIVYLKDYKKTWWLRKDKSE